MEVRAMVRMNVLREATGMLAMAYCVSLSVRTCARVMWRRSTSRQEVTESYGDFGGRRV